MATELSILIPVYNFDINRLVRTLQEQAWKLGLPFEILCLDDNSDPEFIKVNKQVNTLPRVEYRELPTHLGRVGIRNELVRAARYQHLLLLDNDSQVSSPDFLHTYLQAAAQAPVLIGGTVYAPEPPAPEFRLRWIYGREREQIPPAIRNRHPYQSFSLNNIFLAKSVLLDYPLCELQAAYGHEDSKFGLDLKLAGVPVRHIDNPVLHLGLDPAPVFLQKTRQALINLYQLNREIGLGSDTRLIKTYERLRKLGGLGIFNLLFTSLENRINQNLVSASPSLLQFDLYKLGHFCAIKAKAEAKKKPHGGEAS